MNWTEQCTYLFLVVFLILEKELVTCMMFYWYFNCKFLREFNSLLALLEFFVFFFCYLIFIFRTTPPTSLVIVNITIVIWEWNCNSIESWLSLDFKNVHSITHKYFLNINGLKSLIGSWICLTHYISCRLWYVRGSLAIFSHHAKTDLWFWVNSRDDLNKIYYFTGIVRLLH